MDPEGKSIRGGKLEKDWLAGRKRRNVENVFMDAVFSVCTDTHVSVLDVVGTVELRYSKFLNSKDCSGYQIELLH